MKRAFLLWLLFSVVALCADNVLDVNVYPATGGNGQPAVERTTDSGGIHTRHVIIDNTSGASQGSATTVKSTALEASHVLKASAGSLVSLHIYNSKASSQYVLITNSATVPADGAVALLYPPILMPATSNASLTFPTPLAASIGISVCNSSTGSFTKTLGSADLIVTAQVQ